jgi:hypothetical protein
MISTSFHRSTANSIRLMNRNAAYMILHTRRETLFTDTGFTNDQLDIIRLRLLMTVAEIPGMKMKLRFIPPPFPSVFFAITKYD